MGGRNKPKKRSARGVPNRSRQMKQEKFLQEKRGRLNSVVQQLERLEAGKEDVTATDVFHEVRSLAVEPFGLVNDTFRRKLWPFLLNFSSEESDANAVDNTWNTEDLPNGDQMTVEKDLERSLWHYDVVKEIEPSAREEKRTHLSNAIAKVLHKNPDLHYYQGYHDICSVFLLVFDDEDATATAVEQVSRSYHREAMGSGFENVLSVLRLLFPLVSCFDPELFKYLEQSEVEPFVALPWVITWFAHQFSSFENVTRLFDAFLVSHPLFSLYYSASMMISERNVILECECDFGCMHSLLSKLPHRTPLEVTLARAVVMMDKMPPMQLVEMACDTKDSVQVREMTFFVYPFPFQESFGVERHTKQLAELEERYPLEVVVSPSKISTLLSSPIARTTIVAAAAVMLTFALRMSEAR